MNEEQQSLRDLLRDLTKAVLFLTMLAGCFVVYLGYQSHIMMLYNVTRAQATFYQIGRLKEALELYKEDVGHYPRTQEGFAPLLNEPRGESGWRGPYLARPMDTDPYGNSYRYETTSTSEGYALISLGPDGRLGTEDDVTNLTKEPEPINPLIFVAIGLVMCLGSGLSLWVMKNKNRAACRAAVAYSRQNEETLQNKQ